MLETQRGNAAARLTRLAGLRATYANSLSDATNRAKLLERAEQSLTNARSDRAGQGRQPDHPRGCPRYGQQPGQPERVDNRARRLVGRPADGVRHRPALRRPTPRPVGIPQGTPGVALVPQSGSRPQNATPLARKHEPWSLTVAANGSLNCTQALKILYEQGKLSSATRS